MTTKTSDTAAQAAINAAARELHLPTVCAEAERQAVIAVHEHQAAHQLRCRAGPVAPAAADSGSWSRPETAARRRR